MMADGHLGKCKTCTKRDVSKNYRDNIGHYRRYEKMRNQSPDRKRRDRDRQKSAERRANQVKYQAESRKRFPGKYRARIAVANAVRDGRLVRGPCEVCGTTKRVQGHHDDYRRPLVVRWLCFKHHMEHHGKVADPALA